MTVISYEPDVTPSVVRQLTGLSKIRRIKLVVSYSKIRGVSHSIFTRITIISQALFLRPSRRKGKLLLIDAFL